MREVAAVDARVAAEIAASETVPRAPIRLMREAAAVGAREDTETAPALPQNWPAGPPPQAYAHPQSRRRTRSHQNSPPRSPRTGADTEVAPARVPAVTTREATAAGGRDQTHVTIRPALTKIERNHERRLEDREGK